MTNKRKCNCGFEGEEKEFGVLEVCSMGSSSSFIASEPEDENGINIGMGSSIIHICPKCGSLYCFRGIEK